MTVGDIHAKGCMCVSGLTGLTDSGLVCGTGCKVAPRPHLDPLAPLFPEVAIYLVVLMLVGTENRVFGGLWLLERGVGSNWPFYV